MTKEHPVTVLAVAAILAVSAETLWSEGAPRRPPATLVVAQDGSGDINVKPGEDCTKTFVQALAKTSAANGVLLMRPGVYTIRTRLLIPSHVKIVGSGPGKTVVRLVYGGYLPGAVGFAYVSNSDYKDAGNENIWLEGLEIYADQTTIPKWEKGSRLIVLRKVKNLVIRDCYFYDARAGGVLHVWECENVLTESVKCGRVSLEGGDACFKFGGVTNGRIVNCEAAPSARMLAFNLSHCRNVQMSNCVGRDSLSGVWVEPGPRGAVGIQIANCLFYNNRNEGIGICGIREVTVANCVCRDNQGHGIHVMSQKNGLTEGLTIVGCICKGNRKGAGISLRGPRHFTVADNVCTANETGIWTAATVGVIKGNVCTGNASAGIQVFRQHEVYGLKVLTEKLVISGNVCAGVSPDDQQKVGLLVEPGCREVVVSANLPEKQKG